jgi:hypothetical protein
MDPCAHCKASIFEEPGYGLDFCMNCGLARVGKIYCQEYCFKASQIPQSYTRIKRFKRYLSRATRSQSSNSVPRETWDYLFKHGPYRDSEQIRQTLKQSKVKNKCYDSLPFLTMSLIPSIKLPVLLESEKNLALEFFKRIDARIGKPFLSYLYCLEYILKRVGRSDMCPFLNRIQCKKRRLCYKKILDKIFQTTQPTIKELL